MSHPLMDCPLCGSQISPMPDGTCPACGKQIPETDLEGLERPATPEWIARHQPEEWEEREAASNVTAIRSSRIRWLEKASDADVLRFHQTVTDLLDEEGGDYIPPPAALSA
jgi:hypothetical protein